jgi:hypothetical protein
VRADVRKRSHLIVWESIVYAKYKMKRGHYIEDTAGFAGAAMRAGKRAAWREVLKH